MAGLVIFLVPDFEPIPGGTSRQVGYQARALMARGYEVIVLTRQVNRELPASEVLRGLPVARVGLPGRSGFAEKSSVIAAALWLRRRRRSISIVQIVMQGDYATSVRLAGLAERTCVTWAGLGDVTDLVAHRLGRLRQLQWAYRYEALHRCQHVALTLAIRCELEACGLFVADEIPVAVDCKAFRPASGEERATARLAIGIADDELVIVYVGHLRKLKGVDRLITAFSTLLRTGRPARLILVGAGRRARDDSEDDLRRQVSELGIRDRVTFAGLAVDVRPYLRAADLFVLPSFREGLPNTLLEAMASGVPCVAPPSAGGDAVLYDGAGLVPPSNEPADLLEAITTLADDPRRRAALAAVALERVQRYGVERVALAYDGLYRTMALGRDASPPLVGSGLNFGQPLEAPTRSRGCRISSTSAPEPPWDP